MEGDETEEAASLRWDLNATLRILGFILRALQSHGGVLSREEAGSDLSIKIILTGPCEDTLGLE